MRMSLTLIASLAAAVWNSGGIAQESCFCLAHAVTQDIVRYGCEARLIPNRASERVVCQTADLQSREAILNQAEFGRVQAGTGACNPCVAIACEPGSDCSEDIPRLPDSGPLREEVVID